MVPSFHSINAVVGLLFQEEIQNVNWHQLLAVLLSSKLRIHLLCSCFPDLQLAGGTCSFSRCLVRVPAVIQPATSCSCKTSVERGKTKFFSDTLGGHVERKDF